MKIRAAFAAVLLTVVMCVVFAARRAESQSASPAAASDSFDILIRNGHILDGSGGPWYAADIGIRGDRIAAIGKLTNARAEKIIDAQGRIVSPGFIDMLGQS